MDKERAEARDMLKVGAGLLIHCSLWELRGGTGVER